jgi:hypothetical protein
MPVASVKSRTVTPPDALGADAEGAGACFVQAARISDARAAPVKAAHLKFFFMVKLLYIVNFNR